MPVPLLTTLATLAALPLATAVGDHQFFVHVFPLLTARMDPIIAPGNVSAHSHTIYGANNFRSVLNHPDEQLKANCTTISVQADKSNYWAPTLFFINDDGKYEALYNNGGRAYYNIQGENVQPFPPGLRMIAGTAMSRNPYSQQVHAVKFGFGCVPQGRDSSPFLPNATTFPNGCDMIHTMVIFPSCGLADQTLDSDDHFSHMAYPVNSGGGGAWYQGFDGSPCPPSHPIKYPNIHLEIYYYISQRQRQMWRKDRPNIIMANGDTVGMSYHSDFVNGWEPQVMLDAINKCDNSGNDPDSCAPLKESYDPETARKCRYAGMIPAEDLGHQNALDQLPGCNVKWDLSMGDKHPGVCAHEDPGWTAPNGAFHFNNDGGSATPVAVVAESLADLHGASGDDSHFEPWGNETVPTLPGALVGTREDVLANKAMSTAVNKNDGASAPNLASFTDRQSTGIAPGAEKYQVNNDIPAGIWIGNGVAQSGPPTNTSA